MKTIIFFPFRFIKESWSELKKVNWPTWQQTVRLSVLVVVISLAFSVFISGVDLLLQKGLGLMKDTKPAPADTINIPTGGTDDAPTNNN